MAESHVKGGDARRLSFRIGEVADLGRDDVELFSGKEGERWKIEKSRCKM